MMYLTSDPPIRIACVGALLDEQPFDACLPEDVSRLARKLGLPALPRQAIQEHGTRIDRLGDGLACDAFFVRRGEAAMVRHADCMPIVVYDAKAPYGIVAHCGWKGIQLGLPSLCVESLLAEGSRQEDLRVVAGPAISAASFEVSADFLERFPESTWTTTSWGTPAVDLARAVEAQLVRSGLDPAHWQPPSVDTFTDPAWYSHRRTKTPRRNTTVCWIPH